MLLFCVNQQFHARLLRKSNAIRLFRSVPLTALLPQPPLFPLSSMFRIFFQVPYPATPLFATLTKPAGVCTNNSHNGTSSSAPFPPSPKATPSSPGKSASSSTSATGATRWTAPAFGAPPVIAALSGPEDSPTQGKHRHDGTSSLSGTKGAALSFLLPDALHRPGCVI